MKAGSDAAEARLEADLAEEAELEVAAGPKQGLASHPSTAPAGGGAAAAPASAPAPGAWAAAADVAAARAAQARADARATRTEALLEVLGRRLAAVAARLPPPGETAVPQGKGNAGVNAGGRCMILLLVTICGIVSGALLATLVGGEEAPSHVHLPTFAPTKAPTRPTDAPTTSPSEAPTTAPTSSPSSSPSVSPSFSPTTPTEAPTDAPSNAPTAPTAGPTGQPTYTPYTAVTNAWILAENARDPAVDGKTIGHCRGKRNKDNPEEPSGYEACGDLAFFGGSTAVADGGNTLSVGAHRYFNRTAYWAATRVCEAEGDQAEAAYGGGKRALGAEGAEGNAGRLHLRAGGKQGGGGGAARELYNIVGLNGGGKSGDVFATCPDPEAVEPRGAGAVVVYAKNGDGGYTQTQKIRPPRGAGGLAWNQIAGDGATFSKVTSGTCTGNGAEPILSPVVCKQALAALGLDAGENGGLTVNGGYANYVPPYCVVSPGSSSRDQFTWRKPSSSWLEARRRAPRSAPRTRRSATSARSPSRSRSSGRAWRTSRTRSSRSSCTSA